jgi:hypothetical protein
MSSHEYEQACQNGMSGMDRGLIGTGLRREGRACIIKGRLTRRQTALLARGKEVRIKPAAARMR